MTQVYAISMNKGGVGKSSLVSNLAGALAIRENKKILIMDTDGQGNLGMAFGLKPHEFEHTMYDVFLNKKAEDVIVRVTENIHIIPANQDLNFLDFDVLTNIEKYKRPFQLLKPPVNVYRHFYDYIFIDTPPSMGLIAGNVLAVADKVIVPFVPELFSVNGLIRIVEAIQGFKERENPKLEIAGVVGMMVDSRTTLHSEMLQQARRYCLENNIKMFETIIPRSIRFANSTAYEGLPATMTDSNNVIVSAYFDLMKEVLENGKKEQTIT